MQPLITVLEKHINGVSGMDNAMISRLLTEELPKVSPKQYGQIHAMATAHKACGDEDEVRVAEWILEEISRR